ncbi:MAG: YlbF family regulator [Eubacteriales bacterium]
MNVYDIANDLAKALKDSQEYKAFHQAKEKLAMNAEHQEMVQNYMKKQVELQSLQMMRQELSQDQIDSFNKMTASLMRISDIADFFRAQMLFGRMFEDVTKIITETAELDFGFNNK